MAQIELAKKTEALAEEKTKAVATEKLLEEAAKEKLELNRKHYEDAERAKLVLNKLQTTYQHQVIEYERQAQSTAVVIQRLKSEKQVVEDSTKLGVERIRSMMAAWRNWTRTSIDDCSAELWMQWSQNCRRSGRMRNIGRRPVTTFTRWTKRELSPYGKNCHAIFSP